MILSFLKRFAAKLPASWQQEIRRFHCKWKIRKGDFITDEPEYAILDSLISSGDFVIDIGANIGHYTKKFSEIVGIHGRVIAIEPVPETFALLSANMQQAKCKNISLFNIAVSDNNKIVGMIVPNYENGVKNYYEAHLTNVDTALKVLAIPLDIFNFPHSITLIKIDAEDHEVAVLKGMKNLLERDRPILIIETFSKTVDDFLGKLGYNSERLEQSPNKIFRPHNSTSIH
jgi:FkbM family methyltransferase